MVVSSTENMATENIFSYENDALESLEEFDKCISTAINLTLDVTRERVGLSKDQPDVESDDIKSVMLDYIRLKQSISSFKDAYNSTKQATDVRSSNIEELLLSAFEKPKSLDEDSLGDHICYKRLLAMIAEKPESSLRQDVINDAEGDIIITQQETVPIDPITKKEVTDPVRNKICNHIYDRGSIMGHIATRKRGARCPMLGCVNPRPLTADILEDCDEIQRLICRQSRRK